MILIRSEPLPFSNRKKGGERGGLSSFPLTEKRAWAIFPLMKIIRSALTATFLSFFLSGCLAAKLSRGDETGITMPCPMPANMPDSVFLSEARQQMAETRQCIRGLDGVIGYAESHREIFSPKNGAVLNGDQRAAIRSLWRVFLDYTVELEKIRLENSAFWKIFYPDHPEANIASFSLTHSAFLGMNVYGSRLISLVDAFPGSALVLNESAEGIGPDMYDRLKFRVLNLLTFQWEATYSNHFDEWAKPMLAKNSDSVWQWSSAFQAAYADTMLQQAGSGNFDKTGRNAVDLTGRQVFSVIFPMQKNLAQFMGRTKYSPGERPKLVSQAQIDSAEHLLQPGDILLSRSNWYLSNIGLPGFWPHALFYAGTPAQWKALLDSDTGAIAAIQQQSGNKASTLEGYLRSVLPEKYAEYILPDSETGKTRVIIEAISQGVVAHPAERALHADYIAVLRPKVPKRDKALAIIKAFESMGKPYDFDFDFTTDNILVCTELVYKAYQARSGMEKGVEIPLQEILGRPTLPPNNIIELFDKEKTSGSTQFDFVLFLDGREKDAKAVFSSEEALRKTWQRTKWDFLLE